jgi:AhpD family alkylhydroperoxidase
MARDARSPGSDAIVARIVPGRRDQIGVVNLAIARSVGWAIGGRPPNLFTTLARHRSLFRPWLRFAAALMPRGQLSRKDAELLILRVAHNCRCEYERGHHERLALAAGLDAREIDRVRDGPEVGGWSQHQADLIRAADELHGDRAISAELWESLRRRLSEPQLIELCMLVGHYEMLAMTINSLAIQPDTLTGSPPRVIRFLQGRIARRRRARTNP